MKVVKKILQKIEFLLVLIWPAIFYIGCVLLVCKRQHSSFYATLVLIGYVVSLVLVVFSLNMQRFDVRFYQDSKIGKSSDTPDSLV
ncbi:MAG TPA: hypothetical protein VGO09_02310 [Flavisolibacter sp.]|nr:hypothetical protein [Flavisolibacter sp.]